jgi:integrase/recombinase XerD
MDQIEYPPNASQLTNLLEGVFNVNTRRKCAIAIKSIYGIKVKVPSAVPLELDLPNFEDLNEVIKGTRYEMYALLMLHAGFRIGETLVKQPIKGNAILINRQKTIDGELTTSKSEGLVIVPEWLLERYEDWEPTLHYNTVYLGLKRLFVRNGFSLMTPHKLRHAYATYYSMKIPPEALRKQMRHKRIATAMQYYVHIKQEDLIGVMYKK